MMTPSGGSRPGAGRPPLMVNAQRLSIRLSAGDLAKVRHLAGLAQESVSVWIRGVIAAQIGSTRTSTD